MEFTHPHTAVSGTNGDEHPTVVTVQLLDLFTQNALSWQVFDKMVQSESDAHDGHWPPVAVAAWSTHGLVKICCGAPQAIKNAMRNRGARTAATLPECPR